MRTLRLGAAQRRKPRSMNVIMTSFVVIMFVVIVAIGAYTAALDGDPEQECEWREVAPWSVPSGE